ncbi:PK beta-barrel-protein domain-containing protein-like protein [Pseudovirgaria hyperparasitica]|uniref:PK beta-barrel-protein domain-containing protein-like protein n=1 Tax=Pseudovirgaria hyperparasitica TaxID=470096 RepID=A0A6A6W3T9_9PEZI|nr:PK beta-barrel-protein domain-containing protein-like protein [Pseudovirgaria hyperparasitica]KAF2756227.1 PK beta-barrel-protein domain-containing protein-like protein [Pseudovirgaria hyperparasitica]
MPNDQHKASQLQVVAVSRSQPAYHDIHGHKTLTAIVRSPSTEPLSLEPNNGIVGHRSAVHDAQVYALFSDHYDYWTSRLGIARDAWDWAHWGENLTIKAPPGVNEHDVMLGDIWDFEDTLAGQGVQLEVCGGRNPCSRLAWRLGQKGAWLAELAASGLCGVYLKVIRGGTIGPGSSGRIVRPQRQLRQLIPVAMIAQTIFSSNADQTTKHRAKRILSAPVLQNMNRQILERKLSMIEDEEMKGKGSWQGWRDLRISSVTEESSDVKSFYIEATDNLDLANFFPGQFLTVKLPTGDIRSWSLSDWTDPSMPPTHYRLSIKRQAMASLWMHEHAVPGVILSALSPRGKFMLDWKPQFPPRQLYISNGIGITPLLAMLKAHSLHKTLLRTPAVFVHVARDGSTDGHLFQRELPSFPNLRVIRFFTRPRPEIDVLGRDYDFGGRPGRVFYEDLLRNSYMINPLNITPIELAGCISVAYICGSNAFASATRDHLLACKMNESSIHSESFARDTSAKAQLDTTEELPEQSQIVLKRARRTITWKRSSKISLLQLLEKENLEPDYGCREGTCGACEIQMLQGQVVSSIGDGYKEGSRIKACCTMPRSVLVELDF